MALYEENNKGFSRWRYLDDNGEGPGIIYAIGFKDGVVKVGKTTDMSARKSWIKRLRRLGGDCDEISEGWMTVTQNVHWAECAIHEFLNHVGVEIYQGREYYQTEFGMAIFAIIYCLCESARKINGHYMLPCFLDIQNKYRIVSEDKVNDIIDSYIDKANDAIDLYHGVKNEA